jgi:metal-responsive CopG/Arc/MetJ family transcriptional regulator
MAMRKLTFTLPEDLATEFLRRIPPSNRSRYVATAIAAKLREREEQLVRACEAANSSADILNIEGSLDALADEVDRVQEPW